jgi:predicted O-methyltransferase YrrM
MASIRFFYKFIVHFISARNTGGYAIHSPFLFMFNLYVIKEKNPFYVFQKIENLRLGLKQNYSTISITDFGTGSDRDRSVADIAKHSLKSQRYGQLIFRIAHYFKVRNVLELGTSLGLTTAYLAASSSEIKCVSLEGCPLISSLARQNLQQLSLNNIQIVEGNIDNTLEPIVLDFKQLDLVFFDANHRSEPLLRYFELCLSKVHSQSVFLIDDIYWSKDMEFAWNYIKNHPQVYSTFDLFHLGIVFFNTDLHKKHYKIRF